MEEGVHVMKRIGLALALLIGLIPACDLTLQSVDVPAMVNAGQEFDILIHGTGANGSPSDLAAVVLQLPLGFLLVGAWYSETGQDNVIPLIINDPVPSTLYLPEPGHFLAAVSGNPAGMPSGTQSLRVRLRASGAGGNYVLKVAMCGTQNTILTVQQPVGVGDFSLINGLPYAHPITVNPASSPASGTFVPDSTGLGGFALGGWTSLASGDFNGDGLPDLVAVTADTGGPRAFLRLPGGGWAEDSAGLSYLFTGSNIFDVATGDFNGDGLDDIADGNGRAFVRKVMGGFQDISTGLPLQGYEGVACGDVNGDGFDDIVLGGQMTSELRFFFSSGNGLWTESSTGLPLNTPSAGTGRQLRLLDLDNDGALDILWMYNGAIVWFRGDGTGIWVPQAPTFVPLELTEAAVVDVDDDGDLDLVVAASMDRFWFGTQPTQAGGLFLFRAEPTQTPRFVIDIASGLPAAGVEYSTVTVFDMDGDGYQDIVAGRVQPDYGLDVWKGLGSGQYAVNSSLSEGLPTSGIGRPYQLVALDFDADGGLDLAGAFWGMGLDAYRNQIANALGPCGAGNTGAGLGGPYAVLTINASNGLPSRTINVPIGAPVTFDVLQPPSNPNPADFIIWGGFGAPNPQDVFLTPYGNMCFPPSTLLPYPGLFVAFSSVGGGLLSASPTPFTHLVSAGIPLPLVISLQGMIVHQSSSSNVLAITNAVVLNVN